MKNDNKSSFELSTKTFDSAMKTYELLHEKHRNPLVIILIEASLKSVR
jgi:hypothetical protein